MKKKPTTSSFLWILQYFSKQPFCKTFAFVLKRKLTENVKQPFKKRFYVLTHLHRPKTSRSSFPYLSSNKSSVSLLQEFFFAEGKVPSQFYKTSNRYLWTMELLLLQSTIIHEILHLLLAMISFSGLCALVCYFSTKWSRLLC